MSKKQKKVLIRILVSAVLVLLFCLIPVENQYLKLALFLIPYLIIGYDILRKAVLGIVNGQVFDENFLMALATVGAIILGEYIEGTAVMLFYQIGELFQSYAVGKSRRNISALMDIRPDYANIEIDGELEQVIEGDAVISGCVNLSGLLRIETTKVFGESTVSKILDLVENSSMKKSKSENFITRFARYYTPAVCIGALVLAMLPPIINLLIGNPADWSQWIIRALTTLVISCPCALVISIPLSFFGGIGGASSKGVLVKGSNYLEALSQTKYVVCDKTGTLTKGVFEVTHVQAETWLSNEELLETAAYAESYSNHPISRSLKEAYGKPIDTSRVSEVEERSGHGVSAVIGGKKVSAGNTKLMKMLGISYAAPQKIGTEVHVAINGNYAGYILISDIVKPNAKSAIAGLKAAGVKQVVMLTGDTKPVAEAVASELGVDVVKSELLPADKVTEVEYLLTAKGTKEKLAFVGDGINDAPVLSRADLGIAMGALGSDAAIEAADIVLMDDDPAKIATAINISRKTLRIVHQNIVFALVIKFACLGLGAIGFVNMWWAIFADVGVMIIAVLNATRALKYNEK